MLTAGSDSLVSLDKRGNPQFSSPAIAALLGHKSEELVMAVDGNLRVTFIAARMAELLDRPRGDIEGKPLLRFMDKHGAEVLRQNLTARKQGIEEPYDFEFKRRDGVLIHSRLETAAIPGDSDGHLFLVPDIARHRRAEAALREAEKKYRTLFDSAADAMFIHDSQGQFLEVNRAACEKLGYARDDLLKMRLQDINAPQFQSFEPSWIEQMRNKGEAISESAHLRSDGILIPIELSSRAIDYGGAPAILTIARDITERKRAQELLVYHARLLDNVSDAVFSGDSEFRIRSWNRAATRLYGWTEAEVAGKVAHEVLCTRYVDNSAAEARRVLFETGFWQGQVVHQRKDGIDLYADVSRALVRLDDGRIPGVVSVVRDMTERHRMEETRREVDRLKAEFLSSISHELRTPLHSILGFNKLILTGKVPDAATQHEFLGIIDKQGQHLAGLIDDLLEVSRMESGRFQVTMEEVAVPSILSEAVALVSSLAVEKSMRITLETPEALPPVQGDPRRLKQVLVNLIGNAIKYSPANSAVSVSANAEPTEVIIQVVDQGPGITKDVAPHLFERFYRAGNSTTVKTGGTGLGLYIARQIVEAHHGRIWFSSNPGHGSTFRFSIPSQPSSGASVATAP